LRINYAQLWLAVIDVDEARMRKYAYLVGGITDEQFPLFASTITGRDYRVVTKGVVDIPQSEAEHQAVSEALGSGDILQELIGLLGKMPPIIMFILKTNDLSMSSSSKTLTKFSTNL